MCSKSSSSQLAHTRAHSKPRGAARPAFTLIEMLVVLAIIAVLASVVAPQVFRNVGDARTGATRAQIDIFALALDSYRLDLGRYPSTEEGLDALVTKPGDENAAIWRGPYLRKAVPLDPWRRPYQYKSLDAAHDDYELSSLGRDGVAGGTGEDADVTASGRGVQR